MKPDPGDADLEEHPAWLADALDLACRCVSCHFPEADVALLAGSRVRGEAKSGSDYDIILLFDALPDGAWRQTLLFDDQYFEVFAHDLSTLAYFCRQMDRPSGFPALPTMVIEGVSVSTETPPLLAAARKIAHETLLLGPPLLDADAVELRRYLITDLAASLRPGRDRGVLVAVGASLYTALADFALRAAGHWSASGKAVPRALALLDTALASQFEAAFNGSFVTGDVNAVQALVDAVLAPYGGRLREGFQRNAPASWREAVGPMVRCDYVTPNK